MTFPSSTRPHPPHTHNVASRSPQLNAFHPIPMAFNHNINSGNLHASSSTSVPKKRKFFDVVLENGQGGPTTPTHHRGVVGRSGHIVGSSRSLRAEPNFGKYFIACLTIIIIYTYESADSVSSPTSYAMPTLRHDYPQHPRSRLPTTSRFAQPERPPTTNRVRSFMNPVTLGPGDPIYSKYACSTKFL